MRPAAHQGFGQEPGRRLHDGVSSERRALQVCHRHPADARKSQRRKSRRANPGPYRPANRRGHQGEDFFGKIVILAARIASQSVGGQILVWSLLKALVESSEEFDFAKQREVELRGLRGVHSVSDVRWRREG